MMASVVYRCKFKFHLFIKNILFKVNNWENRMNPKKERDTVQSKVSENVWLYFYEQKQGCMSINNIQIHSIPKDRKGKIWNIGDSENGGKIEKNEANTITCQCFLLELISLNFSAIILYNDRHKLGRSVMI